MANEKMTLDQKPALMAGIGTNFAVIQAAQKEVHNLELLAAPDIKRVVENFGAGPHKMPIPVEVPDQDNPGKMKTILKTFFASFRKSGDTWHVNAVDQDSVT